MSGKHQYAKAKGRNGETAVVNYLRSVGIPAERRRLAGIEDMGDISGWPGVVCEVKATKKIDLAGALDEAMTEARNADKRLPFHRGRAHAPLLVVKRRGRTLANDWYAVLPVPLAVAALKALLERPFEQ